MGEGEGNVIDWKEKKREDYLIKNWQAEHTGREILPLMISSVGSLVHHGRNGCGRFVQGLVDEDGK